MNHRHVLSLVCVGSAIVLFAMTGCVQLPSSAAVESVMRCPGHPDKELLNPEVFELDTLPFACGRLPALIVPRGFYQNTNPTMI